MVWLQFFISAGLLIYSGIRLTRYADIWGDRFSFSKLWVGIILLAFITSLPEAIASLTAVISLNAGNLAVGNMLGSNSFNLLIIAIMDFLYRQGPVTNKIHINKGHIYSIGISSLLSAIILAQILYANMWTIGHVSIGSLLVAIVYLAGMWFLATFKDESKTVLGVLPISTEGTMGTHQLVKRLLFHAFVVIINAMWLAHTGEAIAQMTGLGETFVGSVFLAFSTSLPEMVVSVSAMRMGLLDMAFGNIFGSNMLNMFIIFLCSGAFAIKNSRPLLDNILPTQIFMIVLTLIMTAIITIGVRFQKKRDFFGVGWDSIALLIAFMVGTRLLYIYR